MTQHFNDNGDFKYTADKFQKVEIRTTCEFFVQLGENLIGPAYYELAGACAATTVQTIALQDWIRESAAIK